MADLPPRVRLLAQFGSAVAVALSLVFVALEVRETSEQTALNTAALQVAAYQDLIGQIDEWNRTLLDPAAAELFVRLRSLEQGSWDDFTPVERAQANSLLFLLARHADMAFYQYDRGVISEDRLNSAVRPFVTSLRAPLVREHWERVKQNFVPAFGEYVDSQIVAMEGT